MGTVMRFGFAAAGLVSLLFGIGLIAPSLVGFLTGGEDLDFPGGVLGVIPLVLASGIAPLALAVFLFRKAFSRAAEPRQMPPVRTPDDAAAAPITPTLPNEAPADVTAPRPWSRRALVVAGLTLAVGGLLILGITVAALFSTAQASEGAVQWFVNIVFAIIAAAPLALGLWLAHLGEPGIGKRFVSDIAGFASNLRQPSQLVAALRTSAGLALTTLIGGVLLMLISRRSSLLIALWAIEITETRVFLLAPSTRPRNGEQVCDLIATALTLFTPDACANYVRHRYRVATS